MYNVCILSTGVIKICVSFVPDLMNYDIVMFILPNFKLLKY